MVSAYGVSLTHLTAGLSENLDLTLVGLVPRLPGPLPRRPEFMA
jgi:hypothetical protein